MTRREALRLATVALRDQAERLEREARSARGSATSLKALRERGELPRGRGAADCARRSSSRADAT